MAKLKTNTGKSGPNNWFANRLIAWYTINKRDLPWREVKDPYKIWLSEVILQQTQVKQGLGYYQRFLQRFPDVKKLANASENQVLKMWEGLGYYSRARNLHAAAKTISGSYKGKFPQQYKQIHALKGVGDYTAAAIASFAFDLPYAVVDGNVYRVLSRVFGIDTPIDTGAGKKEFQELANALLPPKKAAVYNQAIMEFGAQFCKSSLPDCERCIFSDSCLAFAKSKVNTLPLKSKKTKVKARYFNYMVFIDAKNKVSVQKRKEKDIWKGLHEFPLIESEDPLDLNQLIKIAEKKFKTKGMKKALVYTSSVYKHLLTHRIIYGTFYVFKPLKYPGTKALSIHSDKLSALAFPQLMLKFMRDCGLKEIV